MIDQTHIERLSSFVGPKGCLTDRDTIHPFVTEWRDKFFGNTPLVLMPKTTREASKILSYCNENGIKVVPQGGNTGLVGGGIPGLDGSSEILLSTRRMTDVPSVDRTGMTLTAGAGVSVAAMQEAAANEGLLFALSLASEGSCTAGGVISTNAGGMHVVRYGTTRDMLLGLEAVLANGDVVSDLSGLRKDNTGYALSPLLAGAEGTLGFVTKACFKLFPAERAHSTAWLAVPSPEAALELLHQAREACENQISVFELMCREALEFTYTHIPGCQDPLRGEAPWYVLLEAASPNAESAIQAQMDKLLETAIEADLVLDGTVAQTIDQRQKFWRIRESISEAQKLEGGSIKHDVSLPLDKISDFIDQATDALLQKFPGVRVTPFGHLGDGNLHFNVMQPKATDKKAFLDHWQSMNAMVHDIVVSFGGSISAEHGIGILKKDELKRLTPVAEIAAMRSIKAALDPNNILNPRCLF